ncbi:hypothetical protein ACQYAD_17015 [Neobacillus sp. SM06]|uniref:hypothetical protein n=1 Tax=Neobacillus sp. SM06 TaxID=3422492 RepID=UPI003D265F97
MEFEWDRHNIRHIQRHNSTSKEAEQVFYDPDRCKHNAYDGNRKLIGMTEDGRILTIVYEKKSNKFRPFTGWDSTESERKVYSRRRR